MIGGKFVIQGARPLSGTINVGGSKNAALPILAATLLSREKCDISNVPRVLDVLRMLELLSELGSFVKWTGSHSLSIKNTDIFPARLKNDAVNKMRASILLVGPLLARFGKFENMEYPGGCSIGPRPITTHLNAFRDLGASIRIGKKFFSIYLEGNKKISNIVTLEEFSVTATENMLIFLSGIPKKTEIRIGACEPHVKDLSVFLSKMGAEIEGAGTSFIRVKGKSRLRGGAHSVTPDYIEAGTFLILALSVGGDIIINDAPIGDLDLVIKKLVSFGADIEVNPRRKTIRVRSAYPGCGISGKRMRIEKIQTLPYPGIPTDLQSLLAVLCAHTKGDTLIHEPLYENRLECLKELGKMGARVKILDLHRAIIGGPVRLRGSNVKGSDLRSGAALLTAGLAAKGKTVVYGAEHIERGYEDIVGRLRSLGANVEKVI